jgi:hypothetical protein
VNSDPIEPLSQANPIPGEMPPLSFELVRQRMRQEAHPSRPPRRRLSSTAAIAVSVLMVAAVVAIALTRTSSSPSHDGPASTSHPLGDAQAAAQRAILNELSVMRQPQSDAARKAYAIRVASLHVHVPGSADLFGKPFPSSARLVPLPDHATLLLYMSNASSISTGVAPARQKILGFFERGRRSGVGGCCLSVNEIRRPTGLDNLSHFSSTPRSSPEMYFEVVPDGVTTVRWTFPAHPRYPQGERTQATFKPLTLTIEVHHNVAAAQLPTRGAPTTVTWTARDGQTTRVIP